MSIIDKPTDYFNTVLYTGNGSNPRTLTGVGFQPDWVWLKNRTDGNGHTLADSVRGANKTLSSDGSGAEVTDKNDGHLDAFTSDGFTVGAGVSGDGRVNDGSHTYVAWNWLAGGTASSNTDGSITSSVSANQDAGFSIVSYTGNATDGATVGHGLSSAPQMVITKSRGDAGAWQVLTNIYTSYSEGDYMNLNGTGAKANSANVSFLPTSTTWQMKSGQAGNTASTKIAYCFHSVQGYSKFGSYTGNGNADGTFVYTGFKPAFVLHKRTDSASPWHLRDSVRATADGNDGSPPVLEPNTSNSEATVGGWGFDFLSNGFKQRETNAYVNGSGASYIYMAIAENPFVTSTGVCATAR